MARQLPTSHHKLERVSWHELLNIHYGELLPQLLLINLSQRVGGGEGGCCICPLCCEQNLGILGYLWPTWEHKQFYTSTTDYRWNIAIFPLKTNLPPKTAGKKALKWALFDPTLKDSAIPPRHNNTGRIKSFCSHIIMDPGLGIAV